MYEYTPNRTLTCSEEDSDGIQTENDNVQTLQYDEEAPELDLEVDDDHQDEIEPIDNGILE
jgi:hypothetical protein